jgi:hypothetical protein
MAAGVWRLLFALNLVLLALLAISFPFQEPGSAGRVLSIMSFGIISVSMAGLAAVMYVDWDPF